MGSHIPRDSRKPKVKEYDRGERLQRASFKQYLRNLEEQLLDDDDELDDSIDDLDKND